MKGSKIHHLAGCDVGGGVDGTVCDLVLPRLSLLASSAVCGCCERCSEMTISGNIARADERQGNFGFLDKRRWEGDATSFSLVRYSSHTLSRCLLVESGARSMCGVEAVCRWVTVGLSDSRVHRRRSASGA